VAYVVPHAIFSYAITALTPKASEPALSVSPEILHILSKQCPLSSATCDVHVVDTKPKTTVLQPLRVVGRYTIVVWTIVVAFIAMKVTEAIWYYYWLVWIHACASTMQFLILNPCYIFSDFVKNAFKIIVSTAFWALRIATTLVLRIGDVGKDADDVLRIEHLGDVREDADNVVRIGDVGEDADDALRIGDVGEDADYVLRIDDVRGDADDDFAGQDDAPVEAPVAPVTVAAPRRRSERIAARQCRALFPEVAPNVCVARGGPRRSARLAVMLRVNYNRNKQ
jgi:hypothetical protein